jgi:hypothetical protein
LRLNTLIRQSPVDGVGTMRFLLVLSLMFSVVSGFGGDWVSVEQERDDYTASAQLDDPSSDNDWSHLGYHAHSSAILSSPDSSAAVVPAALISLYYQPQSSRGPPLLSA